MLQANLSNLNQPTATLQTQTDLNEIEEYSYYDEEYDQEDAESEQEQPIDNDEDEETEVLSTEEVVIDSDTENKECGIEKMIKEDLFCLFDTLQVKVYISFGIHWFDLFL